jgi:UDP-N-acetylglucosamine pyrophosphorylase
MDHFSTLCDKNNEAYPLLRTIISNLFKVSDPSSQGNRHLQDETADRIKKENGFDYIQHEEIREALQKGRIGLFRNRLPAETTIEDVHQEDITELTSLEEAREAGEQAIRKGQVAVMSLAAGVGSRWTKGAGVIKALNPFVELHGMHRSFLEMHMAKTRKVAGQYGAPVPHIVATSYLTHQPILQKLQESKNFGYEGKVFRRKQTESAGSRQNQFNQLGQV